MKKLLGIVVLGLFLITPSQADDIRDFQIEGISIGDSLLDYMTEKEIIDDRPYYYKDKKFAIVTCIGIDSSLYDHVQCTYKPDDKKFKIHSVEGALFFENNIKGCLKKKDEIVKDISEFFVNTKKRDYGTYEHTADKSDKSTQTVFDFDFNNGDLVRVTCNDWSKEMEHTDGLQVSVTTNEFQNFIDNEAYK